MARFAKRGPILRRRFRLAVVLNRIDPIRIAPGRRRAGPAGVTDAAVSSIPPDGATAGVASRVSAAGIESPRAQPLPGVAVGPTKEAQLLGAIAPRERPRDAEASSPNIPTDVVDAEDEPNGEGGDA